MIFGFSDVSMSPKTNIIYVWRHQDTTHNSRKNWIIFEKYCFSILKMSKIDKFEKMKRRGPTNPEDAFIFLKILNMGLISSRTYEMDGVLVTWAT